MKIIYLHGYKGENSKKFDILKTFFKDYEVIKPGQQSEPYKNIQNLESFLKGLENKKVFIVGSSFGGFYGLYLSLKHGIPCLLINPSYSPYETLKEELSEVSIQQLKDTKQKFWELFKINSVNLSCINIFLATDDERLDFEELLANLSTRLAQGRIKFFDNKGHGFSNLEQNLEEIKNIIDSYYTA